MQLRFLRSALGAALLLSFAPVPALAETPAAVQTGLSIPIAGVPLASRAVPARGRSIVVDAASARLFMIENGEVVDSMRVIVGKPATATPELRSTIFYATLNPYWNVPVDLARTIVAPNVLKYGTAYLKDRGYEVVDAFSTEASVVSPDSIDWQAVADGSATVHVRQRPGPANSMGQIKFGFPNNDGIFLHDTPKKELFAEENRWLSNGCVRLEDAPRLARWLLGREPQAGGGTPEQFVALPAAVPITITYGDRLPASQVAALH